MTTTLEATQHGRALTDGGQRSALIMNATVQTLRGRASPTNRGQRRSR